MISGVCQGKTEYFLKKVFAWLLYGVAPSVQKVLLSGGGMAGGVVGVLLVALNDRRRGALPQTPQAFVLCVSSTAPNRRLGASLMEKGLTENLAVLCA